MKVVAISLLVLAVVIAVGIGFATMTWPGLSPSKQEAKSVNVQLAEGLHTNATIYRIWDSGLYPYGYTADTTIFWVDESTLLFSADKNPKPATREEAPNRTPWLYLWQLGEKPRPHGENPREASRFYRAARGTVCFQQMKVDPETRKSAEVLMIGPPGKEKEAPPWNARVEGLPLNGALGHVEILDCKQFADPAMAGRIFATDSYHHRYLDRTAWAPGLPPAAGESPVLMKSDRSDRQVLSIPPEELGSLYFRTFQNVFWSLEDSTGVGPRVRGGPMIDDFQKWRTTNCLAVWRIDPASGTADRRCIPFGPWSGRIVDASHGVPATISLVPTVSGLFFTSTHYTDHYTDGTGDHPGPSGLYKLENGAAQRVLAGYLLNATTSPNGCRIAFVYGPNWATQAYGTPGSWTIAAIDLCAPDPEARSE